MTPRHTPISDTFFTPEGVTLAAEMVIVLEAVSEKRTFASEISRRTGCHLWVVFENLNCLRSMGFIKKVYGGNKVYYVMTKEGEAVVRGFRENENENENEKVNKENEKVNKENEKVNKENEKVNKENEKVNKENEKVNTDE